MVGENYLLKCPPMIRTSIFAVTWVDLFMWAQLILNIGGAQSKHCQWLHRVLKAQTRQSYKWWFRQNGKLSITTAAFLNWQLIETPSFTHNRVKLKTFTMVHIHENYASVRNSWLSLLWKKKAESMHILWFYFIFYFLYIFHFMMGRNHLLGPTLMASIL